MNKFDEIQKQGLTDYVESITTKSTRGGGYVCPLCGSGTGKNKTGAFHIDKEGTHWACFSCNASGDIFDLIGKVENISEFPQQVSRAGEILGIYANGGDDVKALIPLQGKQIEKEPEKVETDYTEFFIKAHNNINAPAIDEYLKKRGITAESVEKYNLGYVDEWKSPNAPDTVPSSPRLIIPTSKNTYFARDIRESVPEKSLPYVKQKVGGSVLYNTAALNGDKPVYIVEGEIDCISIEQAGGAAVGLGSTGNVKKLADLLKQKPPKAPIIVALDNDKAGEKAIKTLNAELKQTDITIRQFKPFDDNVKDANEMLTTAPERLAELVKIGADFDKSDEQVAEHKQYLTASTCNYIQTFIDNIKDSSKTDCIPTNFKQLDNALDGGLYEGLYVVGAMSALGKTTFIQQISDSIAEKGNDILYFSLEMSRFDLMAKSISRCTALQAFKIKKSDYAKTVRGITDGKRYKNYNEQELEIIKSAFNDYKQIAKHIYIYEGIGNFGVEFIRKAVQKHIDFTGKKPVVVIDYLQILAPMKDYERATDKQIADKNVLELKRISRDYKIPVITISSFNRVNYNNSASMAAFKESGTIEYSADVLLGLQLQSAEHNNQSQINDLLKSDPRKVEIVILKNRFGKVGEKIPMSFYPAKNYFEENKTAEYDF